MRVWGFERRTADRSWGAPAKVAVAAGLALALAAPGYGAPVVRASGSGTSRVAITPRGGKPFLPTLSDWEGTVNGFPASFGLRYVVDSHGQPHYGLHNVVALRPSGCPTSAGHYVEDVVTSRRLIPLARFGALGLSHLGFGGDLLGARSAMLSRSYRTPTCSGKLSWHMHPARRRTVQDGLWKASFGGPSATFHVVAGGRLATAIVVPPQITGCDGVTGRFDLFIGTAGRADLSERGLKASLRFRRSSGRGSIDGGRGCAGGPFRARLSLLRSGS